jgi:hypothetical protein
MAGRGLTVEQFLERLDRVRVAGPLLWAAACPAHEDRVASMNVRQGVDGRILVHCHAGCSADDIVDTLRLVMADLFPERAEPRRMDPRPPAPRLEPEPVVTVTEDDVRSWAAALQDNAALLKRLAELKAWTPSALRQLGIGRDGQRLTLPVRDAEGVLRGVLRYAPGGDPKMLASKGAPRELWPAPESLPAGTIYLVEGEPDAVSAASLGLVACALPGAGSWKDSWPERFRGRPVVVMTDCDTPGRAAATRAVEHLAPVTWVRSIDLGPDREDGHDLGDMLVAASQGGTVLELRARLAALAPR